MMVVQRMTHIHFVDFELPQLVLLLAFCVKLLLEWKLFFNVCVITDPAYFFLCKVGWRDFISKSEKAARTNW